MCDLTSSEKSRTRFSVWLGVCALVCEATHAMKSSIDVSSGSDEMERRNEVKLGLV
jgi:hypothetical protein